MAYVLLGASWLIMKTDGELQERAVRWARIAWAPMCGGLALISMATPWISETVRMRWFELPSIIALSAIPLMTVILLVAVRALLGTPIVRGPFAWLPFTLLIVVFVLGFRVLVPGFPRQGDGSALRLSGSPQKAPIDKQMFIGETLPGWSDQTGRS